MGENFAFFLPIMMASFSLMFLLLWSWSARAAVFWSAGFGCVAVGFAIPIAAYAAPDDRWSIVADALFASGFFFFSQALLERWRPGWILPARLSIWAGSILLCAYAALIAQSVPLELVASDFGCFLLISLPMVAGKRHLRAPADRALFAAAALTALDSLVRGSTVPLTWQTDGSFLSSNYAFLMQALACLFGLFLALAALAATVLDVIARYRDDAHVDPLSRLLNRRGFDAAVARSGMTASSSILACDIDHFKAINDRHGHGVGDRVIVALADTIRTAMHKGAVAARFGGEEFVIFLPDTDSFDAASIADTIRLRFTQQTTKRFALKATVSFGIAATHADELELADCIARADLALYQAKAEGRNRLNIWHPAEPSNIVPIAQRRLSPAILRK